MKHRSKPCFSIKVGKKKFAVEIPLPFTHSNQMVAPYAVCFSIWRYTYFLPMKA